MLYGLLGRPEGPGGYFGWWRRHCCTGEWFRVVWNSTRDQTDEGDKEYNFQYGQGHIEGLRLWYGTIKKIF
jgi:hypothetical protein